VEERRRALSSGQVRVDVRAIGVNYADVCVRMGVYGAVKEYPVCPGFEVSGVVSESDSASFKPGDEVFGVTRFGGYATELVLREGYVWPKPPGWTFEQAAGFPAVHMTAYHGLVQLAHAKAGESVLIHSAAGGVGLAAVRIAKALGCRVVGVVGAPHKIEACRAAGADEVIDKSAAILWEAAAYSTPDGFDVILDPNGYSTLRGSYEHLAQSGRLLVYGFQSMLPKSGGRVRWLALARDWLRTPRFDPMKLCSENRSVIGFNVVHMFGRRDALDPAMETMRRWTGEGKLTPPPVTAYPFEKAADAHRDLESGRTVGKLILRTSSS
jgi:NADPH:quinone reductase-like Zn-dependent oxidoreductase